MHPYGSSTSLDDVGAGATLFMEKVDYALQIALALEKGGAGQLLNKRTLVRGITYSMEMTAGQAAVLIKAIVRLGGLCVRGEEAGHHPNSGINRILEDRLGEICLAVPEEVKRIDAAGMHSIAGELMDMLDRTRS